MGGPISQMNHPNLSQSRQSTLKSYSHIIILTEYFSQRNAWVVQISVAELIFEERSDELLFFRKSKILHFLEIKFETYH